MRSNLTTSTTDCFGATNSLKTLRPALTRRRALALALLPLPGLAGAQMTESAVAVALKQRGLKSDGIQIDFPPLADTGNAVPLQVDITAPAGLQVVAIEVILPENPNPSVVKLRLTAPLARYTFTTRLRLAGSQDAWVIASYSDGSQRGASAPTLITSSACFDGT